MRCWCIGLAAPLREPFYPTDTAENDDDCMSIAFPLHRLHESEAEVEGHFDQIFPRIDPKFKDTALWL